MAVIRTQCPACGSNNFSTQTHCWSCKQPLVGTGQTPPRSVALAGAPSDDEMTVINTLAVICLSLVAPIVSLCVGFVFLMQNNRQSSKLGWWNLTGGVLGSVVHIIATIVVFQAMSGVFLKSIVGTIGANRAQQDLSAGESILNPPLTK